MAAFADRRGGDRGTPGEAALKCRALAFYASERSLRRVDVRHETWRKLPVHD